MKRESMLEILLSEYGCTSLDELKRSVHLSHNIIELFPKTIYWSLQGNLLLLHSIKGTDVRAEGQYTVDLSKVHKPSTTLQLAMQQITMN